MQLCQVDGKLCRIIKPRMWGECFCENLLRNTPTTFFYAGLRRSRKIRRLGVLILEASAGLGYYAYRCQVLCLSFTLVRIQRWARKICILRPRLLAIGMGLHDRLGEDSLLQSLPLDVLQQVISCLGAKGDGEQVKTK